MSINILPGYDFTFNEMVTSEKLRKWIGGASNSGNLTIGELGLTGDDTGIGLKTTSTWATGVSQGTVAFNTTTGWATVSTKWGYVPLFGTQGGMFSMRIPEGDSTEDSFDRFYEGDTPNMIGPNAAHTPTLPAASYSLGEGYDLFGMNSVNVSTRFMGASDISVHRTGKTFARYPSEKSFNASDAWTASTYVTGASFVHSLYKLGGVQTLRFKNEPTSTAISCIKGETLNGLWNLNLDGTVTISNITHAGTLDRTSGSGGNTLEADESNNLIFAPLYDNRLAVYFVDNSVSSISEVDSINANIKYINFIEDKRLLVYDNGNDFNIAHVDTLGNLTSLYSENTGDLPRETSYDPDKNIIAVTNFDVGVRMYKLNSGTDATCIGYNGGLPYRLDAGVFLRNASLFVAGSGEVKDRYVYSVASSGSLTYIGYDDVTPRHDARSFSHDPSNDSIFTVGTESGLEIYEISSGGTLTLLDYDESNLNWVFDTKIIYNNYIGVAGRLEGFFIFDKTIATDITMLYRWDVDSSNARGVTFYKNMLVGVDYNITDKIDFFAFDVIEPMPSSEGLLKPGRVFPLSQCLNYYGEEQISGGFIPPTLSKDNFNTGGYEH